MVRLKPVCSYKEYTVATTYNPRAFYKENNRDAAKTARIGMFMALLFTYDRVDHLKHIVRKLAFVICEQLRYRPASTTVQSGQHLAVPCLVS